MEPSPSRITRAFVAWTLRHGRLLWALALILAVPATARTAWLYLHLKSDLEELLPRKAESVLAIDELRERMPGLQYLSVVVDAKSPENIDAAERFVDDLAARVRTYPPDLARAVRIGDEEERRFLEKHAPLYMDAADLHAIRERIEARRDWEASRETGALLDDDSEAPPLDFADIEAKYDARTPPRGARDRGARFSSQSLATTMLLIETGGFSTGGSKPKDLFSRVKRDVEALNPSAYADGMRVGYAGDVAISVEETEALLADLSLSSVLVVALVIASLIVYYRWPRSVVVLVVPLLLAAVFSFAIASLPPFGVNELNSNTAFLGSIIVGNGINFGIVLLARYVEARRQGGSVIDALTVGVASARRGTFAASVAAGAAYASLALTQFRGFRQFGIIGGIGMVVAWAVSFLLIPPLIAALDRGGKTAPPAVREETRLMAYVARFVERQRVAIVAVGALLTVLSVVRVRGFDMSQLEYDFAKLRRADTWTRGEGYWGRKMDALLGEYLTPMVILADDERSAQAIAARIRAEADGPELGGLISAVRTIDDVLPRDQATKIEAAEGVRDVLTPRMRAELPEGKRKLVDRILGDEPFDEVRIDDLPRTFTVALRERDGSVGKAVLVYPRAGRALWQGPSILDFVTTLRGIAKQPVVGGLSERPARVAGSLPLSADILASIQRDGPLASLAALLGVVVTVFALFRFSRVTVAVVASLLVGVAWLAASAMVLGVRINFANFIAFPITFGIGVDYAVNVMSRYVQEGRRDIGAALRSIGSAVALCSLTTIIGYSSLLVAENRALFSFGVLAVLGEFACLLAALTLMPAVLSLLQKRDARTLSDTTSSPPSRERTAAS